MLWLSIVFPEVFSITMKINTRLFLKILAYWELDGGFQRNLSFLLSQFWFHWTAFLWGSTGSLVTNTYFLSLESWVFRERRAHKGEEEMIPITVFWARINVMSLVAMGSYSQGGGCFLLLYSYWKAKETGSRSSARSLSCFYWWSSILSYLPSVDLLLSCINSFIRSTIIYPVGQDKNSCVQLQRLSGSGRCQRHMKWPGIR